MPRPLDKHFAESDFHFAESDFGHDPNDRVLTKPDGVIPRPSIPRRPFYFTGWPNDENLRSTFSSSASIHRFLFFIGISLVFTHDL